MTKLKRFGPALCPHDKPANWGGGSIMFRCKCGNVWIGGKFQGSMPQNQGAAAIFGAFSRGPAKAVRGQKEVG